MLKFCGTSVKFTNLLSYCRYGQAAPPGHWQLQQQPGHPHQAPYSAHPAHQAHQAYPAHSGLEKWPSKPGASSGVYMCTCDT